MNSELYRVLEKHLTDNVPELNLVDWDLAQYEQDGEDAVRTTPALYIGYREIEWRTHNRYTQRGVMRMRITLVSQTAYGDRNDMTDVTHINHPGIERKVYRALQGRRFNLSDVPGVNLDEGDTDVVLIETINRTMQEPHSTLSNFVVTTQEFECVIFDYSAMPIYAQIVAALDLDAAYSITLNP